MNEQPSEHQAESQTDKNLPVDIEDAFDWNLIAIMSVWIFLLATFFLIFMG